MKIDDIAKIANVSKSAVSLALNGKPGVSEATRDLVLKIAEEHNYVPLRKPRKKSSDKKLIRFVACKNDEIVTENYQLLPFFSELLSYITEEIKNYPFTLLSTSLSTKDFVDELTLLEQQQPSDGFIVLGTNLGEDQILDMLTIQPNSVIIDTNISNLDCDFVTMNNYQGGYAAADYLISNGHTDIGYCMGEPRIHNFEQREKGFWKALRNSNLTINKNFILEFPAMDIKSQHDLYKDKLTTVSLPSAFFCEDDYIAISLIKTLQSLGYRVPHDVSVIGFDDISEAVVISPELTTMRVRKDIIAKEALSTLMTKLNDDNNLAKTVFVNTTLIERESCLSKIK